MIQPIIDQSGIIHIFKGKQTSPIKLVIGEILTADIMDIFPTGTIQIKINNRVLNAQTQRPLPLNKGDTVYVKVEKPLSDGTITLRILSTNEVQQVQRNLSNAEQEISEKFFKLIKDIFVQPSQQDIYKKQIPDTQLDEKSHLNLIKTLFSLPLEKISDTEKASLLQKLIEVFSNRNSTVENLQEFISFLENKSEFKELTAQLKNLLISDTDITPEKMKQALLNSGPAFEAKLKQALSEGYAEDANLENIKEDLKSVLNNIINSARTKGIEEVVDKAQQILRQIDGYQVLSKTYQSFFTFLPVFWKDIEGGNFAFKSFKRQGKEYHTVFVTLKIKKEETLSFVVTMINKSFFISFSGDSEIMQVIKNHEKNLKERFHQIGLALGGINYITKIEELIKQWSIKEGLISVTA